MIRTHRLGFARALSVRSRVGLPLVLILAMVLASFIGSQQVSAQTASTTFSPSQIRLTNIGDTATVTIEATGVPLTVTVAQILLDNATSTVEIVPGSVACVGIFATGNAIEPVAGTDTRGKQGTCSMPGGTAVSGADGAVMQFDLRRTGAGTTTVSFVPFSATTTPGGTTFFAAEVSHAPTTTNTLTIVERTVPGAPTDAAATAGATSATVTWTAPSDDGGAAITNYIVTSDPDSTDSPLTVGTTTTATLTGLTKGQPYTFAVSAVTEVGTGPASASSTAVTPGTAPDPPTNARATAGDAQATVSWDPPADNGGFAITSYTVTSSPGGVTATTAATSTSVTGLTNGTTYTFTVTATNARGTSTPSAASNAVTPGRAPDAPTGVTATVGDQQATISWTAPADTGGFPILFYTVSANPGPITATTTGATTTLVLAGLSNGTTYSVTVTATNARGTSPASGAATVTPGRAPDPPTNVAATSTLPGQATVTWDAPADTGGRPILSYEVTSSPDGITATATTTNAVVSGLTNGVAYTFTVTATNALGTSGPSDPSNAVTPLGPPEAPRNATAVAGDAQATVSWDPPARDGGRPILFYTVTSDPATAAATTTATSTVMTGLTNGIVYTFTVTATNAIGTGSASAPSNAVRPAKVPGAPTDVTAVAGNAAATVSWTAPTDTGGVDVAIDFYTVTTSPADAAPATTSATSLIVSGLTNGTTYTFTVAATNFVGEGPASAPATATPEAIAPTPPRNVTGTPGDEQVTVSWDAPADNGGSAIDFYTVTTSPADAPSATTSATSLLVAGLTNGTSYTFTVTATNAAGKTSVASAPSAPVIPGRAPDPPRNATAVAGDSQATVSWDPPTDNGGLPVLFYTVASSPGGLTATTTATSTVVTGLTNGVSYTFTVTATNERGTSAASAASNAVTPGRAPDPPTGVTAATSTTPGQIIVTWNAPADNGGFPVLFYTVVSDPGGATTTAATTTATITGLAVGTYTFAVTATNAIGTSAPSASSSPVTLELVGVEVSGTLTLQGVSTEAAFNQIAAFDSGIRVTLIPEAGGDPSTIDVSFASGKGVYSFPAIPDGVYTAIADADGYIARQKTGVVVAGAPIVLPEVELRAGDIDESGVDNIDDITGVIASFTDRPPDRKDATGRFADVNGDGVVNIDDITQTISNFTLRSPQDWPGTVS